MIVDDGFRRCCSGIYGVTLPRDLVQYRFGESTKSGMRPHHSQCPCRGSVMRDGNWYCKTHVPKTDEEKEQARRRRSARFHFKRGMKLVELYRESAGGAERERSEL